MSDAATTCADVVASRKSTRAWQVHVASGDAIAQLRERLPTEFMSGNFSMDFPYDGQYEGVYKKRQYGAAQALYDAMGIKREEKDKRQIAFMPRYSVNIMSKEY